MSDPKDPPQWEEMANSFDEDGNIAGIVLSPEAWVKFCELVYPDLTPEGVADLLEDYP